MTTIEVSEKKTEKPVPTDAARVILKGAWIAWSKRNQVQLRPYDFISTKPLTPEIPDVAVVQR